MDQTSFNLHLISAERKSSSSNDITQPHSKGSLNRDLKEDNKTKKMSEFPKKQLP